MSKRFILFSVWCAILVVGTASRLVAQNSDPAPTEPAKQIDETVVTTESDRAMFAAALAQEEVKRLIAESEQRNQVMQHLDTLVNRFGPRLTCSDNLYNASLWAKSEFERFGLQNVRVEEAGEFAIGFGRGPWWGRMVAPETQELNFNTNSWTAGTRGRVRGPLRMAPADLEEIEKQRAELKGAWVLLATPQMMARQNDTRVRELRTKLEEIGALGIITSTRGALLHTSGRAPSAWDKLPTIPQIRMAADHWKMLETRLKNSEAVELEFDIRNYFKPGPVKYHNVIADLPGTDKPDEFVIVGGHIDSWDGATGTLDNGTGVATTMEAARLLSAAGVRPARTIRFMLWSGEEQGLLGSRAWVKANEAALARISAVLVHDGGTNFVSGITATQAMAESLRVAMAAPLALSNADYPFAVKVQSGLPRGIGSDHDSFLSAGVPGFFWHQAGRSDYNFAHHTQHDTFDQAIPEYQQRSALVIALGALGIANLESLLSREKLTAPPRRRMGVNLEDLTVTSVTEGSVAEKAGAKSGDVFLSVNGAVVKDREQLVEEIQKEGAKKLVHVKRGDSTLELTFEWSEAPPQPRQPEPQQP
ncbi:MAG: M20/M25/M40 family metallo-hydrolase [Planctomycetota bacterium]